MTRNDFFPKVNEKVVLHAVSKCQLDQMDLGSVPTDKSRDKSVCPTGRYLENPLLWQHLQSCGFLTV